MIERAKRLWKAAGDESLPGNDPVVYKNYDFIWVGALLIGLMILSGSVLGVAFAFAFGWQFAWLGHIRYARKKLREEPGDGD